MASAGGGSLFLDEIEAMSPRGQGVLLRFLQDRTFRPIGGGKLRTADVRVVAASNVDLWVMVEQGRFREDLLHRLNVLTVTLPPLRQRPGDAWLLAQTFLEKLNSAHPGPPKALDPTCERLFNDYPWPGNVRELENLVQREFILEPDRLIRISGLTAGRRGVHHGSDHLGNPGGPGLVPEVMLLLRQADRRLRLERRRETALGPGPERGPGSVDDHHARTPPVVTSGYTYEEFRKTREEIISAMEIEYLKALLQKTSGNLSLASRLSGRDRSDLCKVIKKYGLQRQQFPPDYDTA